MTIDASIPLHGLLINRNDENLKQAQYQRYQAAAQQEQQQARDKRTLASLLPQAMQGDKAAMGQVAALDPALYLKLDEAQKQAVHDELGEMGSAVRWSMQDPAQAGARWNQVIDYYSAKHPEVAQYRDHPEMAGEALMQLGQMSEYLKSQTSEHQPSSVQEYEYAKGQGYTGSYMDYRNQFAPPFVSDNGDGTKTIYPHGFGGGQPAPSQGEVTATGPKGQKLRLNPQTNQWEPMGGQSQPGSGGFR